MEDTGNDVPRVIVTFDKTLAQGEGLWVVQWPDGNTTAHGSEQAATAYARAGAARLGYRAEVITPE